MIASSTAIRRVATARVFEHHAIGDLFDLGQFLIGDRLGMGEIETQPVRRNERAFLRDMVAKHLAQSLVQQVGGRMIGANRGAAGVIHFKFERHPVPDFALLDDDVMDEQVADLLGGVFDANPRRDSVQYAGIADLAAGFGIEGGLIENQETLFAGLERIDLDAVAQQGDDDAFGVLGVIAEEFGRPDLVLDREPDRFGRGFAGAGPGLAGLGALTRHRGVESVLVHADFPGAQRLLGQVEREAKGVVELEGDFARKVLARRAGRGIPRRGCRGHARA